MDKTSESDEISSLISKYSPFFKEIKKRFIVTLVIFVLALIAGFIFYENIIRFIVSLLRLDGVNIVFTSPFQFLSLAMTSAMLVAIIVVLPLIIYQIMSFLRPALRKNEFKIIVTFIPFSIILFVSGFGFGLVIMRYIIEIFYQKSLELNIGNFLDISNLLSQVLITSALMGLAFQFPIILTILIRLEIISYKFLENYRLWAYIASLIFAAFLPPTDLLSLFLLCLPLIFLFEVTIIINKYIFRIKRS